MFTVAEVGAEEQIANLKKKSSTLELAVSFTSYVKKMNGSSLYAKNKRKNSYSVNEQKHMKMN